MYIYLVGNVYSLYGMAIHVMADSIFSMPQGYFFLKVRAHSTLESENEKNMTI